MTVLGPSAAIAETLTLNDCIAAANVVLATGSDALRAADSAAATAIPVAALMSSDDAWCQVFTQILGIDIGRIFKAACLKLAVEHPTVTAEADGTATITLLPFTIASSHHPSIVVSYGAVVVPLKFDVELSLDVEGAQLHRADGKFTGASTGSARGVARISLLNAKPPLELGSPGFELPGKLTFSEPEPAAKT